MRGIVDLWLGQLFKLAVLWPAWLLTPEGQKTLFSHQTLWRLALAVVFGLALVALAQTLPADLAFIAAGDLLTYVDIVAIAWIAGAAGVVRDGLKLARRALARATPWRIAGHLRAARSRAMRRRRPQRSAAQTDDGDLPGEGWTVAA